MKKLLKNTDSKNLQNVTKKETEKKKEEVKNTSKNISLLESDLSKLDSTNLELLISQTTEKAKKEKLIKGKKGSSKMYKIEVNTKIRRQLREKRNELIWDILNNSKNSKNPKNQIDEFDKFYKEFYTLNDYTLDSLCRKNSEDNSKELVLLGLEVIKRFKTKK